jgi:TonB family protein
MRRTLCPRFGMQAGIVAAVIALTPAGIVSATGPVPAAETAAVPDTVPTKFEITTLEQFDQYIALRTNIAWGFRAQEMQYGPDVNGRTLAQNAEQYVFTPGAEAALTAQRAKAGAQAAAGDAAGLAATLQAAEEAANDSLMRLELIGRWHEGCVAIAAQETALRAVAEKSPEAERQATRARIDQRLVPIKGLLTSAMQSARLEWPLVPVSLMPEWRAAYTELFKAYNEERIRLVPFAQETDTKNGIAPLSRERSTPCAPPSPSPSTSDKAAIDQSSVTIPEYPTIARRMGFEGNVQIRAYVAATGCPERVEIARSVGYLPIDEVALRWAEGLRFHPATKNGKPTASWHLFSATFRLSD